jgi:hypothetical protein
MSQNHQLPSSSTLLVSSLTSDIVARIPRVTAAKDDPRVLSGELVTAEQAAHLVAERLQGLFEGVDPKVLECRANNIRQAVMSG